MKPEVTIGICFRNPGRHFRLALQSVFAQTFQDWELILLNDISNDGSLELARNLEDPRVRVFSDGQGKSLNLRLNEMIRLARGRFFVRMDADDVMHPDRIAKQLALLRSSTENTVVGSAAYSIDAESRVVGKRSAQPQRFDFRARHSFHHPTVVAHTEWFRRNPYSEHYIHFRAEDAELWCRITNISKFMNIPEPLMFYREASSSFSAYVQTELVLIQILRDRFYNPRMKYLVSLSKELGKLWAACVLEAAGRSGILFGRRYEPLSSAELRAATGTLDYIQCGHLPLASVRERVTAAVQVGADR